MSQLVPWVEEAWVGWFDGHDYLTQGNYKTVMLILRFGYDEWEGSRWFQKKTQRIDKVLCYPLTACTCNSQKSRNIYPVTWPRMNDWNKKESSRAAKHYLKITLLKLSVLWQPPKAEMCGCPGRDAPGRLEEPGVASYMTWLWTNNDKIKIDNAFILSWLSYKLVWHV